MNNLSPEQEYALQKFEEGENLFITGPGGTGKTTLIHYFKESAERRGLKEQVCAMTGCAALLLNCKARTLHSWSGIKLAKGKIEDIISGVVRSSKTVKTWRDTKILIVDEVSMMSLKIFELLFFLGKRIRRDQRPFGGIQVIFTGDFYQLPPVGNANEPETQRFCFESEYWQQTFTMDNHIQLTTMFRQKDPIYQSVLLSIRKGAITQEQIELLEKHVNRKYNQEENHGCIPTKLFPIKSRVEHYNQIMFDSLPGEINDYSYTSMTNCRSYLDGTNRLISSNDLQRCAALTYKEQQLEIEALLNNSSCPQQLVLKKGACVMCTFNLELESGICNGSLGIIQDFNTKQGIKIPVVRFSNGIIREISPQYWQSEEYPTIAISQIPLCLSWALTIHKIQGATLPMADMDIGRNVFEYGQTYVALSRVKSLDGLYLSGFSPKNIRANQIVTRFYSSIPEVEYEIEYENEEEEKTIDNSNNTDKELEIEPFIEKDANVKTFTRFEYRPEIIVQKC